MNISRHPRTIGSAQLGGSDNAPYLNGTAVFYQKSGGVLVNVDVSGLPESETGFFALHIHDGTDCGGSDFADSGSHYNPENTAHPNHAGDLVPLLRCANGKAHLSLVTDRFRVSDIIGRTVVIHSMPDDFRTQPSGDSGMKIACGVIRRVR